MTRFQAGRAQADDETRMQIQGVRDQLKMIELELNGLAENGTATAEDIKYLKRTDYNRD